MHIDSAKRFHEGCDVRHLAAMTRWVWLLKRERGTDAWVLFDQVIRETGVNREAFSAYLSRYRDLMDLVVRSRALKVPA